MAFESPILLINAAARMKDRVALRSEWILPFLYGLLGSMLFVMRAVGNIRLPAMLAMPILMRIALGGMAGIVVGWFLIGDPGAQSQIAFAIAWPFVLAFIVGYGIEALFSILDRMNSLIADTSYSKRDGIAGGR
jgi:cytochrome bd-type quinol oxidase subunit 2